MALELRTKIYDSWTALAGGFLSLTSPVRGARYRHERQMYRTYVAGELKGTDKHYRPRNRSGDAEIRRGYKWVTARVRDQAQNNGQIAGGIKRICTNVVRKGIMPQFLFRTADGKLDKKTNKQWAKLIKRWARYADISGHDSYGALQKLMLKHMWYDGQFLVHRTYDYSIPGVIPLRLELIEYDQLDSRVDGILSSGNIARGGIERDPVTGKPVAYHILSNHPGDDLPTTSRTETRQIDAADIIHVYERDRISQSSGISWLAAVVMEAYRMADYREIHQDTARWQSGVVAWLETQFPTAPIGPGIPAGGQTSSEFGFGSGTTKETEIKETDIKRNVLQPVPHGTKVNMPNPSHPVDNLEGFLKDSNRNQSVGVGMSYEAYTNDYTGSTWASARSGTLEERLGYESQQNILGEKALDKIMAWCIEAAWIASLAPSMPGYQRDPYRYHECVAQRHPGWQWVDPRNTAQASKINLENDLDCKTWILDHRGLDFEDLIETRISETEKEVELAQATLELVKIKQEISNATTATATN